MDKFTDILTELRQLEASTLVSLLKQQVFRTPEGYFGTSQNHLLEQGKSWEKLAQDAPHLSQIDPAVSPFEVPNGYFEQLNQNVFEAVRKLDNVTDNQSDTDFENIDDLEIDEPTILDMELSKVNSFDVPEDYFEQLQYEVLNQLETAEESDILEKNSATNPFNIPNKDSADFFKKMQASVFEQIKKEEEANKNDIQMDDISPLETLDSIPKVNSFGIPVNYFEQLTDNIFDKLKAETDFNVDKVAETEDVFKTKEINLHALLNQSEPTEDLTHLTDEQLAATLDFNISKANPFAVPTDYFDELQNNVLSQIKTVENSETNEVDDEDALNESLLLAGVTTDNPFTVPSTYFEEMRGEIKAEIETTDILERLQSTLDSPSFSVPADYFEELPDAVLKRVNETKVIPIGGRWNQRRAARYVMSIAAMLALFMVGIFAFENITDQKVGQNIVNLIQQYPATPNSVSTANMGNMDEVVAAINQLATADIKDYISDNLEDFSDLMDEDEFISSVDVDNIDFKDLGIEIDQDELNRFLFDELEDSNLLEQDILN